MKVKFVKKINYTKLVLMILEHNFQPLFLKGKFLADLIQ